jgi:hypothetical protein
MQSQDLIRIFQKSEYIQNLLIKPYLLYTVHCAAIYSQLNLFITTFPTLTLKRFSALSQPFAT